MISKLISREELADLVWDLKSEEKKIVFTNGCFDLLHVGHVRYLQEAKDLGDVLIIGVNSDESVRKLKGEGRPLVPALERAEILSALGCVDFVTIFDEETPNELISLVKPDWHVKGGDYSPDQLPEAQVVVANGGKVKILNFVPNHSTSKLMAAIFNQ